MILFEAVAIGLLLSLVTGGSLRNIEQERLRAEWLLLALLPLQLLWPRLSQGLGISCGVSVYTWILMMVALVAVLIINARQRWVLAIAALGIALNITVIAVNGAMPVSMRSVSELGAPRSEARAAFARDCLHEELAADTRVSVLADVITVPGPEWQRAVVSVGDLLLAFGLGGWVFVAARRGPP
ncbi:MAG: DUF5317 family protein [Coriobacteriia bacterium]|nr:DUF5317 family protein [Coriobacteriia bacterium]